MEKLAYLIEPQTTVFGAYFESFGVAKAVKSLLWQKLERQEIEEETNQQRNSLPTTEPDKTSGVLPDFKHESRETPESHDQSKTNTFIPEFFYVHDDYDRDLMFVDLLMDHESGKGNVIIYAWIQRQVIKDLKSCLLLIDKTKDK